MVWMFQYFSLLLDKFQYLKSLQVCFCFSPLCFFSYLRALPTQNHFKFNSLLPSFLDGEHRIIRFNSYSGLSCYNYALSGENSLSLPHNSAFSTNTAHLYNSLRFQIHMRDSSYTINLGKDLNSLVPASLCSHQYDNSKAPGHGQVYLV